MDIIKLFEDYHIQYWTEGKNVSPGWVQIRCLFCRDTSNHMGYNLKDEYFSCWRCGSHPIKKVLSSLLHVNEEELGNVFRTYSGRPHISKNDEPIARIGSRKFKLPGNTSEMLQQHRKYLINRGFDPDKLIKEWGLLGTGPVAILDNVDYKHRIVAPIKWQNEVVSFQARDITGKHQLRYITCPKPREIKHHKHILYGNQKEWKDIGIIVEGITDVWRLGPLATATFGTEYTTAQMLVIRSSFKKVFVIFDEEPQAQKQAKKLISDLRILGVKSEVITITGDPGGMKQDDADHLINKLMRA
jgi:hypothetical protein